MKAVMYEEFGVAPTLTDLPDPTPQTHGVVIKVEASMLEMIRTGVLAPQKLIAEQISLEDSIDALASFGARHLPGISVITDFS